MERSTNPRTVEEVILDFKGRRAGIIKALTKDVELFYSQCVPNNPSLLCLYGLPDQQWQVTPAPLSQVELPDPKVGINHSRDTMAKKAWLCMVGLYSSAWLHAVAAFFADKYDFDKAETRRLFSKINDFASIKDVIAGKARKRSKIEGQGLPVEMLVEVLCRLPVRDVVRCRSVCKVWRSLVDDPDFVDAHYKNCDCENNAEESHLLIIEKLFYSWDKFQERVLVRRSDTFRKVIQFDRSLVVWKESWNVISHVNGLMLMTRYTTKGREIVLWNPSINKLLLISEPSQASSLVSVNPYYELSLWFDASCNDYKVIAIVYSSVKYLYHDRGRASYIAAVPGLIQVYMLSKNSWNSRDDVYCPPSLMVEKQVFFNGAVHWANMGPDISEYTTPLNLPKDFLRCCT